MECANYSQLRNQLDSGDIDLVLVDGDAQPTGGIGLCRQFKNEIADCPPIVVLLARAQDRWLAAWSQADATMVRPIDPVVAARTVAETAAGPRRGDPRRALSRLADATRTVTASQQPAPAGPTCSPP